MRNARNIAAARSLQRARQNVFKNAVRFDSTPFVAAPPPLPRLSLSRPVRVKVAKSTMRGGSMVLSAKRPHIIMSSSIPVTPAKGDSSTESADDVQ